MTVADVTGEPSNKEWQRAGTAKKAGTAATSDRQDITMRLKGG